MGASTEAETFPIEGFSGDGISGSFEHTGCVVELHFNSDVECARAAAQVVMDHEDLQRRTQ